MPLSNLAQAVATGPLPYMVIKVGSFTRRVTKVTKRHVEFDQHDVFGFHPFCRVTRKQWERWCGDGKLEVLYGVGWLGLAG